MAAYGVADDAAGALPWSWAEERLLANRNYWVVTVSGTGRPHAMPVWGVWLPETERFWFSCAPGARKARNLEENPHCVVAIDDTVECVSMEGRARIVEPDAAPGSLGPMIDAYLRKYFDDASEHAEMEAFLRGNTVIEVTPERAFGIIEREEEFAERATRWRW